MNKTKEIILRGDAGLTARFAPAGARLLSLDVPTASGPVQVVIGTATDTDQPAGDTWGGTICGRVANRIADASFVLDGVKYALPANNGTNTLHGGPGGFGRRDWDVEAGTDQVTFRLSSADGDMGFPGALETTATYGLSGTTLWLEMTATTSKTTLVNLTHHAYWNLLGKGNVLAHEVEIPASRYTPVDERLIPTGPLVDVAGTAFDFRAKRPINGSYDHNFCLDAGRGALHLGARVTEPGTGRVMEVWTTEPGIQLYTGDHFSDALKAPYSDLVKNGAIALEPQTYPNAANEPSYPSAVLRPGETYGHRMEWRFSGF
ncbi:aldose epimerase family protein [Oryzibacter oryziterrae]|uniref:aldose epimerase family protein n=1 Tax=Oryzibacter oryziterrae TaxID=2766474 RepID=UPI001F31C56F|nr:aldose epimerase family protein [Oryzibacter oryziterrae]